MDASKIIKQIFDQVDSYELQVEFYDRESKRYMHKGNIRNVEYYNGRVIYFQARASALYELIGALELKKP